LEINSKKTKSGRDLTEEEIGEKQAKLDEYMKSRQRHRAVVHEVKKHVTAQADRVIEAVQDESRSTRAAFQDVLKGDLPTGDGLDPREELRTIKAAKAMMRNREESLRALVKAEEGPKPAKRQKTESPAAVPEVSASQLKLAEAFVKRHEKEDLRLCGSQYIGQYIHQVPEHSLKALQKSLKDYWTLLAELRPRCGNESYILQQYLADHWRAFHRTQEGPSKSPSAVISEFMRVVRGPVVACKEEVE